jgi:drug/metabolite transporter (DMT)-like permease
MGVVYGLLSALFWGTADFLARLATERVGTRRTVFWMQLSGALMTSSLLVWPAVRPQALAPRTLLVACAIGLLNAAGGVLLYRALEIGTVSLVSPISSAFAAIAAGLSIAAGERPAKVQLVGLFATALGVVGASIPPRTETIPPGQPRASRSGVGLAAGAAVCWGIAFFSLRFVVGDFGSLFPVVISRTVSALAVGSISLAQRADLRPPRGAWRYVLGIALFDSVAFVTYNLGVAGALTAVVSILSSLFAAVTVLLAFVILRERLSRLQWLAVAVILAGVGMVSSAG